MLKRKIVFLDRDGVINEDSEAYIKNWGEFEFIDTAHEALRLLSVNGFECIVITNQAGIGRGLFTFNDLEQIHRNMVEIIKASQGVIRDIMYCPHHPDEECGCRKPQPGMISNASKKHNIHLPHTYMVGDRDSDIKCGVRAGCGRTILVKTGDGLNAKKNLQQSGPQPDYFAEDILDAARWIVADYPVLTAQT